MTQVYDILVVGGGPAGLYTADRLARAGRSVAVFEEHTTIGLPVHCTGILAAEAFSRFVLPRTAILGELTATRFHSPSGHELTYSTDSPETVVIDRQQFDQSLADQAVAAGAKLYLGERVVDIQRDTHAVTLRTKQHEVSGQLVVIATGAAYHLHRQLGLDLPTQFVQTAQGEIDCTDLAEVELYFGTAVALGSFSWLVPIGRDGRKARIGLMANRDAEGHFQRFLHSASIRSRRTSERLERFRRRPIPLAPLRRTFGERTLVVGDAAGLTKPTTGGGIYYSLLSAEMAACAAGQALASEDYSAAFLAQYQRLWKTQLGSEVWWGRLFRRQAEHLSDSQIDEAFQLVVGGSLDQLIREHATFNWHGGLIQALLSDQQIRSFLWRVLRSRGFPFGRQTEVKLEVPEGLEAFRESAQTEGLLSL